MPRGFLMIRRLISPILRTDPSAGGPALSLRPFHAHVPDDAIRDLHDRLDASRWPDDLDLGADERWSFGIPKDYLRALVDYWRNGFDWRAAEARLNRFEQFIAPIDGLDVHFIHQRSPHHDATPLLLVHGWPGSVVEFLEVIPRLTEPEKFGGRASDAFHVVCPSLPGYGFSAAPRERGMTPRRIAERHAALMSLLGYERFVAQGGDWGAVIGRYLPDICADRLAGLHFNLAIPRPPEDVEDPLALVTPEERALLAAWDSDEWALTGYYHIQGTKPQTLAYGLADSPVGLAAWIAEKFHGWTHNSGDIRDAVSWDDLLTNIALYWFTGTIGSSIRLYREHFDVLRQGILPAPRCAVPTGLAIYPHEIWRQPRAWAEREYNLVHWYEAPRGGHFAALEQPDLFTRDLWAFHRRITA